MLYLEVRRDRSESWMLYAVQVRHTAEQQDHQGIGS